MLKPGRARPLVPFLPYNTCKVPQIGGISRKWPSSPIIMEKVLSKANVLGVVFSFLDIKSLGKLAQVSK